MIQDAPVSPKRASSLKKKRSPELQSLIDEMIDLWDQGHNPNARAFLRLHPELIHQREAVLELAYEEYLYRLDQGMKTPPPQVFASNFPACRSSLCKLLVAHRFVSDNPQLVKNSEPIPWPELDETFLGFRLEQELGRGAFGRVFLAKETSLGDRPVVVKISSEFGQVEAEILGKLNHENIVPIHSVRRDDATKLTVACMPFLGRATLCDVLDCAFLESDHPDSARVILEASTLDRRETGRQSDSGTDRILVEGTYVEGIIHLGAQIAQALASVHAQKIFHRDLKPSNVLLTPTGRPMLLDFNLSFDEQGKGHLVGGTLPYMAPEQLAALRAPKDSPRPRVDGQADLYALGVILFELLTGKHPFGPIPWDLTNEELCQFLAEKQAGPLPSLKEALPSGATQRKVARVVERCLAHDPSQRYVSAVELDADLRQCLPRLGRVRRWLSRHRRLSRTVLGGVLGVTLLAGVGMSLREPLMDRMFHEGVQAYYAEDPVRAIDCFSKALEAKADPTRTLFARARSYQKLAQLHGEQDNWHRALDDLEVLDQQGKRGTGAIQACIAYCEQRKPRPNYSVAAVCYESAIKNGFVNAAVLNNLAYCCFYRPGTIDEAPQLLQEAIKLDPSQQAFFYNLGISQLMLAGYKGQYIPEEGLDAMKRAIQIGPCDQFLYHRTACLLSYVASRNNKLSPEERTKLVKEMCRSLESAIDLGFNPSLIEKDLQFVQWRNEPEFRELLKRPVGTPALVRPERVLDPVQGLGE